MKVSTRNITRFAVLAAIAVILAFTSLGYIQIGPFAVTILHLPVIVGAIVMGPAAGAGLGAVFGLCTFIKSFSSDQLGVLLMQISPAKLFVTTVVTRTLMGFLVAVIFKALHDKAGLKKASYVIASTCGALLNTLLFMSTLFLLFGTETAFLDYVQIETVTIGAIIALIGLNGVLETAVCLIFGFVVERIDAAVKKNQTD